MKYKFKQDEEIKQILTSLEEKIYKNTFSSEKIYNSIMNNTKSSMNREMNMKNKEKNDDFQMKSPNRPIFHMNNMKNSHVHEYFVHAYKDNIENKEYNLNSKDITSNYPYLMRNIDNIKNKEFSNSPSSYKPNQTTLKDRLSKEDDVEFNIKKIFDLIDDLNKKVDSSKEREELLNQKLIELKTDMERKNKMLNENKTEKEDKDRSIIEIKEDLVKMRKDIISIQEKESSHNDEIEKMKNEMKSVKGMVNSEENEVLIMEINTKINKINEETENKVMKIEEILNEKIKNEVNTLKYEINKQRTQLEEKIKLNEENVNKRIIEIRKEIEEHNYEIKSKIETDQAELKNIKEENKENFEILNKIIKKTTQQNEEAQVKIKSLFYDIDLLKSEKRHSPSEDIQLKEELKKEIITIKNEINKEKDEFQLRINDEILMFKEEIKEEGRLNNKSVKSEVEIIKNNFNKISINLNETIKKYEDDIKKEFDSVKLDVKSYQMKILNDKNDKNKEFSNEIDMINRQIRGVNDKIKEDELRNIFVNEEVKKIKVDVKNLNDQLNNLINTKSHEKYKIQINDEIFIENNKENIDKSIEDLNIFKEKEKKDLIIYTNQEVNNNDKNESIINNKQIQIDKENDEEIEIEVKGEKINKSINFESIHSTDKKIKYNNQLISETSHKKVDLHLENIKYHEQIDNCQLKSSLSVNESHDVISEDKEITFHINQSCMNHNILKSDETTHLQTSQHKTSIFIDNHQFEEIISTIKNDIDVSQINNILSKKFILNQEYIKEYNHIYVKSSFPGYMRKYIIKLPFSIEYETENDFKQMDDYIESVGVSDLVDDEMEIGDDIDVDDDGIDGTKKIRNPFMISNIEKDEVFDESSVEEIIDVESI